MASTSCKALLGVRHRSYTLSMDVLSYNEVPTMYQFNPSINILQPCNTPVRQHAVETASASSSLD